MTTNEFRAALERDRRSGFLHDPAITDWRYIQRTRHDVDQSLIFEYHGPSDLVHWVADRFDRLDRDEFGAAPSRSFWRGRPSYIPHLEDLLARSATAHERLLSALDGFEYDAELHGPQDVYNVQDFHYCTRSGAASAPSSTAARAMAASRFSLPPC